jgi:hypothetical protein
MATIANMTVEELKKFVEDMIDERLTKLLGTFELDESSDEANTLSWDDIRAGVERHRWSAPSGAKSSLQLLREDRES